MLGRIHGKIVHMSPPQVVIDCGGVGYEVDLPMSDFADLPTLDSVVILFTHLQIREDAHNLYGFLSKERRDCFRTLIKVSGIGPRIGLALLSTLTPNDIELALDNNDIASLCRTPGIGKKMAERMVLELKGKLVVTHEFTPNLLNDASGNASSYLIRQDIIQALSGLGYSDKEIMPVVKQLAPDMLDLAQSIKQALKILNKH